MTSIKLPVVSLVISLQNATSGRWTVRLQFILFGVREVNANGIIVHAAQVVEDRTKRPILAKGNGSVSIYSDISLHSHKRAFALFIHLR